jgi:predicted ABC-type ATPase
MSNNPQLLFVAGPNGAGKSTFSKELSEPGAIIFDVDIVVARIEAQSPNMPKKQVYEDATKEFLKQAISAVNDKRHFTLETNFRDDDLVDVVAEFKRYGYTTNMIYLTLESIDQSVFRVNQRVKNGGHFVDLKTIEQNYKLGLQYLEKYADRFDNLQIINASGDFGKMRSLLSVQEKQLVYLNEDLPDWIENELTNIARQYKDNDNERPLGPRR